MPNKETMPPLHQLADNLMSCHAILWHAEMYPPCFDDRDGVENYINSVVGVRILLEQARALVAEMGA